ncbi:MAG: hypothetical protein FWG79_07285, partial [Bacteroidales bacterium]|nr:hypothetical protein [Bacteroidales bacterium]
EDSIVKYGFDGDYESLGNKPNIPAEIETQIETHNTNTVSHADIRERLVELQNEINDLFLALDGKSNTNHTHAIAGDGKIGSIAGFSQANFTPEEKNKLAGIDDNANRYTHPRFSLGLFPSLPLTGANVYSNVNLDNGHITGLTTRALTPADIGAAGASHSHSNYAAYVEPTLSEQIVPGEFWLDYTGGSKRQVFQRTLRVEHHYISSGTTTLLFSGFEMLQIVYAFGLNDGTTFTIPYVCPKIGLEMSRVSGGLLSLYHQDGNLYLRQHSNSVQEFSYVVHIKYTKNI